MINYTIQYLEEYCLLGCDIM